MGLVSEHPLPTLPEHFPHANSLTHAKRLLPNHFPQLSQNKAKAKESFRQQMEASFPRHQAEKKETDHTFHQERGMAGLEWLFADSNLTTNTTFTALQINKGLQAVPTPQNGGQNTASPAIAAHF